MYEVNGSYAQRGVYLHMWMGSNSTVGIDLGATGARAVEVVWKGDRPVVERWAALEFESPITDWLNADAAEIGHLVRGMLEKRGIRSTWAAHSVCGESLAPQYFNFPKLLPEDIAEAVRIEVEGGLPFRVEDALIAYIAFPDQRARGSEDATPAPAPAAASAEPASEAQGEGPKPRTHGLAIAADNSFVSARLAILQAAGVEPFSVEADATACGNAFRATGDLKAIEGATAILNVGHRYTNLTLLHEGTILIRDIPAGGQTVTKTLAGMLNLSEKDAEEVKRTHWERGPQAGGPLKDRMGEVTSNSLGDLCDRVQDSIQFWVGERLVPGVGRVLLTGGGAQIRELPDILSETLSVPVERWNPLSAAGLRDDKKAAPWAYRLTVAFGLALRKFPRRGS